MKKILILLPFILLISCGVQKRKYQKGFYVNWNKSAENKHEKKHAVAKNKEVKKESPELQEEPATRISSGNEIIVAGDDKINPLLLKKENKTLIGDGPCDDIIFKDGSEVNGKVIEITPTEVKYKKCSMPDGPTYVAKKSDLFMIKYANGTREVFKAEQKANDPGQNYSKSNNNNNYGRKETNPFAIAALVMGILSFVLYFLVVTSILAIVFGNIALRRIKAQPDRYKGEGMAIAGKILGIIYLVIVGILLIIAFVFLFSLL